MTETPDWDELDRRIRELELRWQFPEIFPGTRNPGYDLARRRG